MEDKTADSKLMSGLVLLGKPMLNLRGFASISVYGEQRGGKRTASALLPVAADFMQPHISCKSQ